MAWSASSTFVFREFIATMLKDGSGYTGLDTDILRVSLYDNDITPDKDAALTSSAYNTGQWVTAGNEVVDTDGTSNWGTGASAPAITGAAVSTPSTGVVMFDATDTTHSSTVTITNAFGCLVWDDTMTTTASVSQADQGVSSHYFGGGQSVTTGTFTVVWHTNGLFRITV